MEAGEFSNFLSSLQLLHADGAGMLLAPTHGFRAEIEMETIRQHLSVRLI